MTTVAKSARRPARFGATTPARMAMQQCPVMKPSKNKNKNNGKK